jgi:biotin transport system substrate-specific component
MNNSRILSNNLKIFQGINVTDTNIALILIGTLLLTISAKVQVPFWPVPMTMQTFVVFLIGATYGLRLSLLTLVTYLYQGAIGLPVFAAGGGIAYLTGPTAGFLYGMTIAAVVIGYFANNGYSTSYIKSLFSIILGTIIIFSLGVLYLGSIIGFSKALQGGLLPFIPSELFKIILAVLLIPTLNKIIK